MLSYPNYKCHLEGMRYTGEDREQWGFDTNGDRILPDQQLQDGFAEYARAIARQTDLSAKAQDLFSTALGGFTKLHTFSIGFVHEVLNLQPVSRVPGRVLEIARKIMIRGEGWQRYSHDAEDAIMALKAIAASNTTIRDMLLCNDYGMMDAAFLDLSQDDFDLIARSLKEIRHLQMDIGSKSGHFVDELLPLLKCARFLTQAENIESAYIIATAEADDYDPSFHEDNDWYTGTPPRLKYLIPTNKNTWPHLNTLHIQHLRFEVEKLTSFFEQHKASLKWFSLVDAAIVNGSWYEVFDGLRCYMPSKLLLRDLRRWGSGELFFRKEEPHLGETRKQLKMLDEFMRSGVWAPELPVGLMQKATPI